MWKFAVGHISVISSPRSFATTFWINIDNTISVYDHCFFILPCSSIDMYGISDELASLRVNIIGLRDFLCID